MIITTSRKPSRRTRSLGRDLERVLLGKYITRGKASLSVIVEKALNEGESRIILISDIHGNPGKIQSIKVFEDGWTWHPLILNLSGVSLQREVLSGQHVRVKKARFNSVSVDNKTNHDVVDYFGLEASESSRNRMVVLDDRISFYMGSREVGPRLLVKEWFYASEPDV